MKKHRTEKLFTAGRLYLHFILYRMRDEVPVFAGWTLTNEYNGMGKCLDIYFRWAVFVIRWGRTE